MQIIAFNFEKISAEKKSQFKEKTDISASLNITSISPQKLDVLKDKDVLKFEFEFALIYKPEIADIRFLGHVSVIVDPEKFKDVILAGNIGKSLLSVSHCLFTINRVKNPSGGKTS